MRRVLVLEDAAEDIEEARAFYDRQEYGAGEYFVQCILSDFESLGLFSGIHAVHFGFYRLLAERFPFGIYYRETANGSEIFAVLDLRREPGWIHEELKGRYSR